MIIGIDASRLIEFNRTGTENYLYNVIKNLSKIDTTNTYIVYGKEKLSTQFIESVFNGNKAFRYVLLRKKLSWTQVSLAQATFTDHLDVLFCPWQTIPVIKNPHTKIVSVIHGFEYKPLMFGPTYFSIIFSQRIVAVSNFTYNEIVRRLPFSYLKSKLSVIYEGVDTELFKASSTEEIKIVKNKYGISQDYVLFVGTLNKRKNIENMLKGFSKVLELEIYSKSLSFIFAGKIHNEYKRVLNLPQNLGIENSVKFLGYVPDIDLPSLLSGAKFLAFVSLSEGFGLPLLEALACNCRVLTSNNSALAEIGDNNVYCADSISIKSIYENMLKVLNDTNNISSSIAHLSKFSWTTTSQKLLHVLLS